MVAPGGHAWLLLGGGHVWLLQGGACMVAPRGGGVGYDEIWRYGQ